MNKNIKNITLFILALCCSFVSVKGQNIAQASKNYTIQKVFDEDGNVISYIQVYKDKLGRTEQSQQKDLENNNVIVQQTIFDRFGRPAIQTLAAPAYRSNTDSYISDFVKNTSNTIYNSDDFDQNPTSSENPGEVFNPKAVNNQTKGTLGWYYSEQNNEEAYVPSSPYPYVRTYFSKDFTSRTSIAASAGFNLKMGSDHERRIIFKHLSNELMPILGTNDLYYKSISIDEEKLEEVSYTDAEGKLIAQCYSGDGISNCIPNVKTYRLNHKYGKLKSVDLHIPVAATLKIQKVLPTSNCTSVTADVTIELIDLSDGTLLVEGTDYNINNTSYEVSFLGRYDNRPNFIQVKVYYPQNWLNCAANNKPIDLKDQIVTISSSYGNMTLYKYDSKGNLIQMIPPSGIKCIQYNHSLQSSVAKSDDYKFLFGTKDVDGECVPNHTMNQNLFTSPVFNLTNTAELNYHYEFGIWASPTDPYFESTVPTCDYSSNNPSVHYNFDDIKANEFDPETGALIIEEEGGEVEGEYAVENYDMEFESRKFYEEVKYKRTRKPEIILETPEEVLDYMQVVDTFLTNRYLNGDVLESLELVDFSGEADTAHISNSMARRRGGTSVYGYMNGGGNDPGNDDDFYYPCEGHCTNGVQDCGETGIDIGGGCPATLPPCHKKPLAKKGTFRGKINAYAKDRVTNLWEDIDIFKEYRNGAVYALHNEHYFYFDVLYDCECNYYLSNVRWSNHGSGDFYLQDMEDYEQLKFDLTEVLWAPNTLAANVFTPVNTHNTYEFFAHFIRVNFWGEYKINPYAPAPVIDLATASNYEYNFYNQLTKQTTPDEGETNYHYDNYNRLKFVQTAAQAATDHYTYVNYDQQDRIKERGVLYSTTYPSADLNNDIVSSAYTLSEQKNVEYDKKGLAFPTVAPYTSYDHSYQKGKVTKTKNDDSETWYGYDQKGRVSWMLQHIPDLGASKYYSINYTYNAQGNIEKLDFQKDISTERFVHHYDYDANGKLLTVKTGTDGIIANATLNATYYYYQHGALKRVELGNQLQGIDYVYTINGRLKSINNPVLGTRDPGKDGETGSSHAAFAQDIFGMTLDYFVGDYTRDGTGIQSYSEHYYDIDLLTGTSTLVLLPSQYNGNINSIRWRTRTEVHSASPRLEGKQLAYIPQYDERHRMVSAQFAKIEAADIGIQNTSQIPPLNVYDGPSPSSKNDYKVWGITYDLNGNLQTLNRKGTVSGGLHMDNLTFNRTNNRLSSVSDIRGKLYPNDLDNQSANNYTYDASGRMTADVSDKNYINYNNDDLATAVYKDALRDTLKSSLVYDERGKRIKKTIHDNLGVKTAEQYYIRDANGILLAVIDKNLSNSTTSTENPVYGSAQLGTYTQGTSPSYRYQLTDHLGNVRATIAGAKVSNEIELLSMQDYYPFGSKMPDRSILSSDFYKQGYQGQAEDEETGFNSFELRLYDARIGGWLSPDPYKQHISPYMAMSNNPLSFIDPDGGFDYDYEGGIDPMHNENGGMHSNNSLAFWENLQNACPECGGQQLSRLKGAWGTGRQDLVMGELNWEISRANGTVTYNEGEETFVGVPVYGPYNNKIGEEMSFAKTFTSNATNYINTSFLPELIEGVDYVMYNGKKRFDIRAMTPEEIERANTPMTGSPFLPGGGIVKGGYTVYRGIKNGRTVYYGITKNLPRRIKEHGDRFDDILEVYTKVSTRSAARGLEQLLISNAGGVTKLHNKINSIGLGNPNILKHYQNAIKYLQQYK